MKLIFIGSLSMNTIVILVCVTLISFIAMAIYLGRSLKLKKDIAIQLEKMSRDASLKQDIVLKQLEIIGDLLYENKLPAKDIIFKTESALKIIEANNTHGNFTDVIKETRQYVASELKNKLSTQHAAE